MKKEELIEMVKKTLEEKSIVSNWEEYKELYELIFEEKWYGDNPNALLSIIEDWLINQ